MQLQLVTLEQAKKLKEMGFDWFTLHYYYNSNFDNYSLARRECEKVLESEIPAPSVALALKWFRDEKRLNYSIESDLTKFGLHYEYDILGITFNKVTKCDTYEVCESALLDAMLEYTEGK